MIRFGVLVDMVGVGSVSGVGRGNCCQVMWCFVFDQVVVWGWVIFSVSYIVWVFLGRIRLLSSVILLLFLGGSVRVRLL